MKNNNLIYIGFLFLLVIITSCNKEEYTEYSTLAVADVTATLNADLPNSIMEQDSTFIFTITLDKPQVVDLSFKMSLGESTASEGHDFDYTHEIVIPAYKTSGKGEIKIYRDLIIEPTESFTIVFGAASTPNVNFVQAEHTMELTNDADAKPTATINANIVTSLTEEDVTYPFTIDLDQAQIIDLTFSMALADGATATEGEDFDFTHSITIPAGDLSGAGEIKIYRDSAFEETEYFTIIFGEPETAGVNFGPTNFDMELFNFVDPNLNMVFEWDGTATVDGQEVSFCEQVDLDVLVFDTDGNDLGIYDAATGACPEYMTFSDLADGTYELVVDLWSSGITPSDPNLVIEFPVTGTFTQSGVFSETITQSSMNSFSTVDMDGEKPLATVTISNGEFTVTAP